MWLVLPLSGKGCSECVKILWSSKQAFSDFNPLCSYCLTLTPMLGVFVCVLTGCWGATRSLVWITPPSRASAPYVCCLYTITVSPLSSREPSPPYTPSPPCERSPVHKSTQIQWYKPKRNVKLKWFENVCANVCSIRFYCHYDALMHVSVNLCSFRL